MVSSPSVPGTNRMPASTTVGATVTRLTYSGLSAPSLSTSWNRTVYTPGAAYACASVSDSPAVAVCVCPSPQSMRYSSWARSIDPGSVPVNVNGRSQPGTDTLGPVTRPRGATLRTVTSTSSVASPPNGSLTVSLTVYVPWSANACLTRKPVPVWPSPKSHSKVTGSLSGSNDPAAVNVTSDPSFAARSAPARATGTRSSVLIVPRPMASSSVPLNAPDRTSWNTSSGS